MCCELCKNMDYIVWCDEEDNVIAFFVLEFDRDDFLKCCREKFPVSVFGWKEIDNL